MQTKGLSNLDFKIEDGRNVYVTRDQRGLISAAQRGHKKFVEVLIKTGADVNKLDKFGYTALMYGVQDGYDECANLLRQAGAHVNKNDTRSNSAVWLVTNGGH